ncbi:MAG: hypothetical protein RL329_1212, partial [Bacteroidota bacterium]
QYSIRPYISTRLKESVVKKEATFSYCNNWMVKRIDVMIQLQHR